MKVWDGVRNHQPVNLRWQAYATTAVGLLREGLCGGCGRLYSCVNTASTSLPPNVCGQPGTMLACQISNKEEQDRVAESEDKLELLALLCHYLSDFPINGY